MTGGDLPTGLIDEPPPSGGPSPIGGDAKSSYLARTMPSRRGHRPYVHEGDNSLNVAVRPLRQPALHREIKFRNAAAPSSMSKQLQLSTGNCAS